MCDGFHSGMRLVRVGEAGIEHRFFTLHGTPATFDEAFELHEHDNDEILSSEHQSLLRSFVVCDTLGLPREDSAVSPPLSPTPRGNFGAAYERRALPARYKTMPSRMSSTNQSGSQRSLTGSHRSLLSFPEHRSGDA